VILGRSEWEHRRAIGQREEARLFAGQELFDHDRLPSGGERRFGLRPGLGNDHTFARREPVRLDDHRQAKAIQRGRIGRADIARGRDAGAGAQILVKPFDPSSCAAPRFGAEHRHARRPQRIA
jgi:hypothetical protein